MDRIEARLRAADQIKRSEVPHDVPMATWALAWCLTNPAVTAVLPGCKTLTQLDTNAAAAELDLSHHSNAR